MTAKSTAFFVLAGVVLAAFLFLTWTTGRPEAILYGVFGATLLVAIGLVVGKYKVSITPREDKP